MLVVVNKRNEQKFFDNYISFLTEHNKNDFDNWKKRQQNLITAQFQNIDDAGEQREKIDAELNKVV